MGKNRLRAQLVNLGLVATLALAVSACGSEQRTKKDQDRDDYLNETSTNWAMVRGYPRGTAYNPFEEELNPSTVHGVETIWESEGDARFVIQHGERVFSTAGEAYDLETGEVLWSAAQSLENSVICKGVVLTAVGATADADASVRGLLPASGRPRDDSPIADGLELIGEPVAKGSIIVFGTTTSEWNQAESPARFVAYDLVSRGSRTVTTPGRGYRSLAPVAISSGQLFAPALEPRSGGFRYVVFAATLDPEAAANRTDWATVLDKDLDAESAELPQVGAMVLAGRVVVPAASQHEIVALDQRSGQVLWRKATASRVRSMAINFDDVFVAGTDQAGELMVQGFSVESGKLHFTQALGPANLTGQLVLAGEVLYLGSDQGELLAISASKGDLLNRVMLGGHVNSPIVTRGRVFASNGQRLLALGFPRNEASQ